MMRTMMTHYVAVCTMIARVRNYTYRRRRRHYHRRNAENEELTLAGLMRKRTTKVAQPML
jgi:hypothetical protein